MQRSPKNGAAGSHHPAARLPSDPAVGVDLLDYAVPSQPLACSSRQNADVPVVGAHNDRDHVQPVPLCSRLLLLSPTTPAR